MSIQLWDRVESYLGGPIRMRVMQPLPKDSPTGQYEIKEGVLKGEGVFYVPTGTKFYERPKPFVANPAGIALHYTTVHAANRKLKSFDGLVEAADCRLNDTEGAIIDLKLACEEIGYIPDAVSLCMQNATKRKRMASWCFCVGSQPLPDGRIPIAQYSPNLDRLGTWHAGSPKTWRARKVWGKKTRRTSRGYVRWDGYNYCWPEVEVPGTNGDTLVISNVNPYTIGIELMNVGPYRPHQRLRYPGLPTVWASFCCGNILKANKKPSKRRCPICDKRLKFRLYEKPSVQMIKTLKDLVKAIRERYGNIPVWGHQDIVKTKIDPWPPFPLPKEFDEV